MGQAIAGKASTVAQVRAELGNFPLEATSANRAWRGINLDRFGQSVASNLISPPRDHHLIGLCLENSPYLLQERCGRLDCNLSLTGEIAIMPAGCKSRWDGLFPRHLCMRIDDDGLQMAADAARQVGTGQVDLCNGFRVWDPVLQHLGSLFDVELDQPGHPGQAVLVESLAAAIVVHLVRAHSSARGVEVRPALSVASRHIRRAVAYIGDRPFQPISLDKLAEVAGLSPFHFAREFRKQVGQSPARYVEEVRLDMAKRMLRDRIAPLCDVALAVGFSDQSHFTRRFKTRVGCTPGQYVTENARRLSASSGAQTASGDRQGASQA